MLINAPVIPIAATSGDFDKSAFDPLDKADFNVGAPLAAPAKYHK